MSTSPSRNSSGTAPPFAYWEARARRFAAAGRGLGAVCSYGMPGFYNRTIELTQRLALAPWLRPSPGSRVLDLGCGVGRWSRRLAARGAIVTGVDISPTMLRQARRRTREAGLAHRCHFLRADLATLELEDRFGLIVGVTVLQHIVDEERLRQAVGRVADHLRPDGSLVLLEVAPTRPTRRCDSETFRARPLAAYVGLLRQAGLETVAVHGVDPVPLKTFLLPHYRKMPGPVAISLLALATALTLPFELLLGRRWSAASWHKVLLARPERVHG